MNKLTENKLKDRLLSLSTAWLWVIGIAMTICQYLMMGYLNVLYDATEFPVSYMVGQTAFDGDVIKGYYSVLKEKSTFDDYCFVQIVDYLFMLIVFFSHLFVCLAIYKILPAIKWLQTTGIAMIIVTPMAAIFDAIENLISFVMLANPENFANWLAIPYSSFAVAKFFVFTLFMVWVAFSLVVTAMNWAYGKLSQ